MHIGIPVNIALHSISPCVFLSRMALESCARVLGRKSQECMQSTARFIALSRGSWSFFLWFVYNWSWCFFTNLIFRNLCASFQRYSSQVPFFQLIRLCRSAWLGKSTYPFDYLSKFSFTHSSILYLSIPTHEFSFFLFSYVGGSCSTFRVSFFL